MHSVIIDFTKWAWTLSVLPTLFIPGIIRTSRTKKPQKIVATAKTNKIKLNVNLFVRICLYVYYILRSII